MSEERPIDNRRVMKPGVERAEQFGIPRMDESYGWPYVTGSNKRVSRPNIRRIVFHGSTAGIPSNCRSWDASMMGDGSVMAWLKGSELHFAAEGGVIAPEYCGHLFAEYSECEEIRFNGHFDTSRAIYMSGMFSGCKKLRSLDVSGFDTSHVTNMMGMFRGCLSLTALNLTGFDTSSVKDMNGMFGGCGSLTALDLSGFNTSSVKDMAEMFNSCVSLSALNLSGFDTSSVSNMALMFYNCKELKRLDLSGFNTARVNNMQTMFGECQGLKSLNLRSFDTRRVYNMEDMFRNCASLTALNLSNFDTASAVKMDRMFKGCRSLTSLDISNFNTARATDARGFFDSDPFRKTDLEEMFLGCDALSPRRIRGYELLPPGAQASLPRQDAAVRERLLRESEAAKQEHFAQAKREREAAERARMEREREAAERARMEREREAAEQARVEREREAAEQACIERERALKSKAAPEPAAQAAPKSAYAQKAADWDTLPRRGALSDMAETLRLGAQDERVHTGGLDGAKRERKPLKESNLLWFILIALFLAFCVWFLRQPQGGVMVNGKWQSFPTPKPTIPTAEEAQQQIQNLEQRLETNNSSDSEISALEEAAEVIGGG